MWLGRELDESGEEEEMEGRCDSGEREVEEDVQDESLFIKGLSAFISSSLYGSKKSGVMMFMLLLLL